MECTAINCYGRWGVILLVQQEFVTILVRTVILECTIFNSDCTSRHISCRTGIDTVASVTFSIIIGRECTVFYSNLTTMMSPYCTTICTCSNLNNTITCNSQFRIVWYNDCITVCCRDSLTIQIQGCITLCDFNRRIEVQVFCKNNSSTHFNSLTQIPLCSRNKHYTFTNCYIRSSYAFIDNINSFSITCRTINGSNLTAIFYSYIPLHYCQCTNFNTCTNNSSVFCRSNHKRCHITLLDIYFTMRNIRFNFWNCFSYRYFNDNLTIISTTVFIFNGNLCTVGNWSKWECCGVGFESSRDSNRIICACYFFWNLHCQIVFFCSQRTLNILYRCNLLNFAITTNNGLTTDISSFDIIAVNSNIVPCTSSYFIFTIENHQAKVTQRTCRYRHIEITRGLTWSCTKLDSHFLFINYVCCWCHKFWFCFSQSCCESTTDFVGSSQNELHSGCVFRQIVDRKSNDTTQMLEGNITIWNATPHRRIMAIAICLGISLVQTRISIGVR